jgi:putative transposase
MKRKRFSTEQIIKILNEAQLGISAKDLCRKYGISEQTFSTCYPIRHEAMIF